MPCYLDSAYVNIINDIYTLLLYEASFHFSPLPPVAKLYLTLGDAKDCMDAAGFPVFTISLSLLKIHIHWVSDAI